jgi:hypothetical protein
MKGAEKMSGELDAKEARLNVTEARRLVAEACLEVVRQVEDKIREASKAGLSMLGQPFDGLTVACTSEVRGMVKAEFEKRGFAWQHHADQRDGDYDAVSW